MQQNVQQWKRTVVTQRCRSVDTHNKVYISLLLTDTQYRYFLIQTRTKCTIPSPPTKCLSVQGKQKSLLKLQFIICIHYLASLGLETGLKTNSKTILNLYLGFINLYHTQNPFKLENKLFYTRKSNNVFMASSKDFSVLGKNLVPERQIFRFIIRYRHSI